MKIRAQAALSAASILLVAATAAGCGGSDDDSKSAAKASDTTSASSSASTSDSPSDSPSDSGGDDSSGTSQADFCGAFSTFEQDLAGVNPSAGPASIVKTFKDEAKKLRSAGTPADISDEAANGYDAVLNAIDGLSDDATLQDLSNLDSSLSAADKSNAQAFETYLQKECPDLGAGTAPSASVATPSPAPSTS